MAEKQSKPEPEFEPQDSRDQVEIPKGHYGVIVSMTPGVPLIVTEAEHRDLEAQGLLLASTKEGARLRPGKEGN